MSESPDQNVAEARRWLHQAAENLASARWLGQGRMWAQACFFCQQAAETALKAVLIYGGERNLHTHSTTRLVKQASASQPAFADVLRDTSRLDRHYVGTRYPNGVTASQRDIWEEHDFRDAEALAAKIVQLAESSIQAT